MNKDLKSYIKVYRQALPSTLCENTIQELQKANWDQHNFYNAVEQKYYSNANEPKYTYEGITTTKSVMDTIWKQVESYVLKDIKFPWWNSWQGFNIVKFNRYDTNTQMEEHCDHIHDMFDGTRKGIPILSVVGLLNSNFKGGDFVILEDEVIKLNQGDIVIFPSLFLYPHKVTSVSEGIRYSFASWVW